MDLLIADPFITPERIGPHLGPDWRILTPGTVTDPERVLAVVTESDGFAAAEAERFPNLRVVVTASTGTDYLDLPALTALGITVFNVPDYCTEEVSDHALAAGLGLLRNLPRYAEQHRDGAWDVSGSRELRRFSATTVAVIGLGRIGAATIRKFRALGMSVVAVSASGADPAPGQERAGAPVRTLAAALPAADLVVLAGAARPGLPPVLDADALALLAPHAAVVNVARAALADLDALCAALGSGALRAAWFDVWDAEPPRADDARTRTPGLFLSPHVGWASREAEADLWRLAAAAVRVGAGEAHPFAPVAEPVAEPGQSTPS